jgi:hypothetical protein
MANNNKEIPECPHCGKKMGKWATPQMPFGGSTTWTSDFLYVCFNDKCPYFVGGWDWMWNNYQRKVSYRYRLDPTTGQGGPIPVASYTALKDGIIGDTEDRVIVEQKEERENDYFYATLKEGSLVIKPYCACGNPLEERYFCERCKRQCSCKYIYCDDETTLGYVNNLIRNNEMFKNFKATLGPKK